MAQFQQFSNLKYIIQINRCSSYLQETSDCTKKQKHFVLEIQNIKLFGLIKVEIFFFFFWGG